MKKGIVKLLNSGCLVADSGIIPELRKMECLRLCDYDFQTNFIGKIVDSLLCEKGGEGIFCVYNEEIIQIDYITVIKMAQTIMDKILNHLDISEYYSIVEIKAALLKVLRSGFLSRVTNLVLEDIIKEVKRKGIFWHEEEEQKEYICKRDIYGHRLFVGRMVD